MKICLCLCDGLLYIRGLLIINKFKIKKILYIFLSLIILSCGKDDETAKIELTDPIIGVWLSEGTTEDEGVVYTYKFTLTFNSDKTGSADQIISYEGETDSETELFTWENKSSDFKAISQTYNIIYDGDDYGGEEGLINFSDDFKTFEFDGDDEQINPFTKQ